MTIETDTYILETGDAEASLNRLAGYAQELADTVRDEAADSFTKMFGAVAIGQAVVDAFKTAIRNTVELLKDSVHAAEEAAAADLKLARALQNTGYNVEKYNAQLSAQASQLEELTGIDDEYYKGLQALMLTYGVAPTQMDKFTKAALDLAAATGQDATAAVRLLARAHAEGKDEIKKYGIEVDAARFEAEGFDAVLAEIEKKFGGMHTQIPEHQKDLNKVNAAWESFKETLGGSVLELGKTLGVTEKLVAAVKMLQDALKSQADKDWEALPMEKQREQLEQSAQMWRDHLSGRTTIWEDHMKGIPVSFERAQKELLDIEKKLKPQWLQDVETAGSENRRAAPKMDSTEEQKKAQKEALAAKKKYAEDMENISLNSAANLKKMDDADDADLRARIEAQGDWEVAQAEEQKGELAGIYEWEHSLAEEAETKRQQAADRRVEAERAMYAQLADMAESYGRQALDFLGGFFVEALTYNKEYTEAYKAAEIERRIADAEEQGAKLTHLEVEKDLAAEAKATQEKKTAEFLAGIAKQAAIEAIMEGARAVAAAARYDYGAAAQHGVAAGAYAAVAAAAGISAAVISGNRGMTRDEKDTIESLQNRKKEREERVASATGPSQGGPVQQNVYYFGISGMNDIQQAAELERLRRKAANLETGI